MVCSPLRAPTHPDTTCDRITVVVQRWGASGVRERCGGRGDIDDKLEINALYGKVTGWQCAGHSRSLKREILSAAAQRGL